MEPTYFEQHIYKENFFCATLEICIGWLGNFAGLYLIINLKEKTAECYSDEGLDLLVPKSLIRFVIKNKDILIKSRVRDAMVWTDVSEYYFTFYYQDKKRKVEIQSPCMNRYPLYKGFQELIDTLLQTITYRL